MHFFLATGRKRERNREGREAGGELVNKKEEAEL